MAFNVTEIQAQQLNPLAPMAFLTPDAGYQATIAAYVMAGSIGALIWDILINVDSDYKLLFKHKIGVPTMNRFIVAFFAILWLAVLGASITVATVGNAVHLGPTKYCSATKLKQYASAAPITFAINDTFVFLAISWRLLSNASQSIAVGTKTKVSFGSMLRGKYLPSFSKAMLQDGQVYYLVSVTSNIVVAVLTWASTVPLSYRLMFTIFNVALTNMMACRVYRNTRFGNLREETVSSRWIASQLGRADLESGRVNGNQKSVARFISFKRPAQMVSETDDCDSIADSRGNENLNVNIRAEQVAIGSEDTILPA
ncbi:hypothetical protein H0H92_005653 [Tricholoma furcatifolium]|nr:hypothetical protein H0H92_005653 [Tricholoma furcatifolium]